MIVDNYGMAPRHTHIFLKAYICSYGNTNNLSMVGYSNRLLMEVLPLRAKALGGVRIGLASPPT